MNALRILEISWMALSLIGLSLSIYNLITEGPVAMIWPLLFTIVAGIFYSVRRKQRIAFEKHQNSGS